MVIQDQATGHGLDWKLGGGNASELTIVRELLPDLLDRWPKCPIETRVGDKEYAYPGRLRAH
jgi:hypothetical protein